MKKILAFLLIATFVVLYSCITGSLNEVPDYKIAYVPDTEHPSIYTMNPDGTGKELIHAEQNMLNTRYRSLFWDLNNYIYFIASRPRENELGFMWRDSLYRLDYKSGINKMIYGSESTINYLISDNAYQIAFRDYKNFSDLVLFDLTTNQVVKTIPLGDKSYINLCWGPGSNHILLYSKEDLGVYSLDLVASSIIHLATLEIGSASLIQVIPSPDASKIAYWDYDLRLIKILDLTSQTDEVIVQSDNQLGSVIWADNTHLLFIDYIFSGASRTEDVYVVNTANKISTKIFSDDGIYHLGRAFPDGKRFSLIKRNPSDIPGGLNLYIANIFSEEIRNITSDQYIYNGINVDLIHSLSNNIIF